MRNVRKIQNLFNKNLFKKILYAKQIEFDDYEKNKVNEIFVFDLVKQYITKSKYTVTQLIHTYFCH